jgi:hypothetical protein
VKLDIRDFNLSLSHISLKLLPYFVSGSDNPQEDNTETSASPLSGQKSLQLVRLIAVMVHTLRLFYKDLIYFTLQGRVCVLLKIHHYGLVRYLKFGCLHFTRSSNQQVFQISSRLVSVIPMVDPVWRFNLTMNTDAVLCESEAFNDAAL